MLEASVPEVKSNIKIYHKLIGVWDSQMLTLKFKNRERNKLQFRESNT